MNEMPKTYRALSPTPYRPPLDFPEALRAVIAGHKITKAEWGDDEYYGVLHGGFLVLHKPAGSYPFYPWKISEADMLGTDWQIFE